MNAKKTLDLNNWTYALFNGTLPRIITHSTNIGLVLFENPPKRWYRNQTKHTLTHSHAIKSKTANSNTEFTTRSQNQRHANYETSYEQWTHSWITFDLHICTIYFFYFTLLVPLSFRWMAETGYLSKISHWLFNWAYRNLVLWPPMPWDQRTNRPMCVRYVRKGNCAEVQLNAIVRRVNGQMQWAFCSIELWRFGTSSWRLF